MNETESYPATGDPRSPEERRFLCPECDTVKLPRQQDFDWANRQLPVGITREDVCIWTQDSDGTTESRVSEKDLCTEFDGWFAVVSYVQAARI